MALLVKTFIFVVIWAGACALAPQAGHCFDGIIGIAHPFVSCEIDSDNDGLVDCMEDKNRNGIWEPELGETDPHNPDTDGDGLLDGEEGDLDGDGVLGPHESDPLNPDTDGDGVPDGVERRIGTLPNKCDTDDDGLSDGVELGYIQPVVTEEGCHGLMAAGTNYRNPYAMDPLNPDSDGDGLLDGEEDRNANGWVDPDETDPSTPDTDGDGLDDYIETTGDFDGDGLADFDFRQVRCEGGATPVDITDLDCDGIPNARDLDSDSDGCPDAQEGGWLDANNNGIPDVYDKDASICPEPPPDSRASGGAAPPVEGGGSPVGLSPLYPTDGAACTMLPQGEGTGPRASIPLLLMIFLIILLFSTARPFIRQTC